MSVDPRIPERNRLLAALDREGFTGAYLAVGGLNRLFQEAPGLADADSSAALGRVILSGRFSREHQAFFLYRAAADILVSLLDGGGHEKSPPTLQILDAVLETTQGHPHRAAAEAVGALPLSISGPAVPETPGGGEPVIGWRAFLDHAGIPGAMTTGIAGRSLILAKPGTDEVLAVKLARPEDRPESLCRESVWADLIGARRHRFCGRFDIPRPQPVMGRRLFRLSRPPAPRAGSTPLHPGGFAAAFWVHREYFTYPNSHHPEQALPEARFLDILCRNALLLGQLSGMGVLHTAPIPLFHNRIQRTRRSDLGVYEWHRGGRLDRWLFSCRYPNFGVTGVRDFEHFSSLNGSVRGLYRAIGTQLLGLLLVAGSYFRNKQPDRFGFDPGGRPVDVRHLFDPPLLDALVRGIFSHFYEGFVGRAYLGSHRLRTQGLVDRLIEEMGVDRHMEEILRTADQDRMSDEAFRAHLLGRGLDAAGIAGLRKGARDIVLHTGPHLGGFNQQISLPELIHFLETAAAICIAHRFAAARRLPLRSG
ncbi:SidJ-related pseudokinase [Desulfococcus sp.]|uniref:SidJ-related pseudokinase n=1 Tax=Desulfococcus sp. TaxID=2025834 RepID=UPI003593134C